MADVRERFFSCIKRAWETEKRIYVKDKTGTPFMTIDPEKRHTGPEIEVGAQFVKDNFSSVCVLAKFGMVLKVTVPKSNGLVYLRRYTSYEHPCDPLIRKWQEALAATTMAGVVAKAEKSLVGLIEASGRKQDGQHEQVHDLLKVIKLGIARMAIGHKPFAEGMVGDAAP